MWCLPQRKQVIVLILRSNFKGESTGCFKSWEEGIKNKELRTESWKLGPPLCFFSSIRTNLVWLTMFRKEIFWRRRSWVAEELGSTTKSLPHTLCLSPHPAPLLSEPHATSPVCALLWGPGRSGSVCIYPSFSGPQPGLASLWGVPLAHRLFENVSSNIQISWSFPASSLFYIRSKFAMLGDQLLCDFTSFNFGEACFIAQSTVLLIDVRTCTLLLGEVRFIGVRLLDNVTEVINTLIHFLSACLMSYWGRCVKSSVIFV